MFSFTMSASVTLLNKSLEVHMCSLPIKNQLYAVPHFLIPLMRACMELSDNGFDKERVGL